ncbi:MAG: NFACT family protein [Myxococcales bacterium]
MSLSVREIEVVVQALQPLVGGFVQKLHVPEQRTAVLELRRPGTSYTLLICAEAGRTRLHLVEARGPSPENPFPFQAVLRGELTGLALDALRAREGERVVELVFRGKERTRTLIAELLGRHGNLFLVDEANRILAVAGPNTSERRDNRIGREWIPPLERGALPASEEKLRWTEQDPVALSRVIDAAYGERERRAQLDERRQALLSGLRTKLQRLERTIGKVQGDLQRMEKADEFRARGELLKSNLHRLKKGMTEAKVTAWTERGAEEVVIPLDPARTPLENLERAFHQYKRLSAGQSRALERLLQLEADRDRLRAELERVKAMSDEEVLAAAPRTGGRAARKRQGPRMPYREYVSTSGQRIRVGRNARDNDALTLRHAKGNDLWLHARGVPGSHVVVPLERDAPVRDDTLRDAALLAAHFSDLRGQDRVEVVHTRVKYVRKGKGAAPGAVTYSQEKALLVSPEPQRVQQLLESAAEE